MVEEKSDMAPEVDPDEPDAPEEAAPDAAPEVVAEASPPAIPEGMVPAREEWSGSVS